MAWGQARTHVDVECDARQGCFVDAEALERGGTIELDVSAVVDRVPLPPRKKGKKPAKRDVSVVGPNGARVIAKMCAALGRHCVIARKDTDVWVVLVDGVEVFVRVADLREEPDDAGVSTKPAALGAHRSLRTGGRVSHPHVP